MREPLYCKCRFSDDVTIPTTEWGNVPFRGYGMVQLYRLETFNNRRDAEGALWLLLTRVALQLNSEQENQMEDIQIVGGRYMSGDEAIEMAVQKAQAYFDGQFNLDFQNLLAEWMIANNQVAQINPPPLLENDGDA